MKSKEKVFFIRLNYLFNRANKYLIPQIFASTASILIGTTIIFGTNHYAINSNDALARSSNTLTLAGKYSVPTTEATVSNNINKYRDEINLINLQILELLSSRGEVAKKIGEEKRKQGLNIYDPEREKEIIHQLIEHNKGPFDDVAIKNIFEEIFKASRNLQKMESENDALANSPNTLILDGKYSAPTTEETVSNNNINKYRDEINLINLQILELLSSRGEVAKKIGEEKRKHGLNICDPEREKEIIHQLIEHNKGPFDDVAIKNIFEEIFKASRDLQKNKI